MRDRLNRLKNALIPGGGVRERAVKSSIWISGIKLSGRGLQFVKLAILARLLAPEDFGLMGIALLVLLALQRFSQLGISTALVQMEEDNVDDYLDTMWVLNIVRGALLAGFGYILAPYIALFFDNPDVTNLVRVLAVIPLIHGFRNPAVVYFRKDLEYHWRFVLDVTGNVVNFVAAVGYAMFIAPTVWALVVGNLVESGTKTTLSYLVLDYRPWPRVLFGQAKELLSYGKWITASAGLSFLVNQGDDAFVGWFLGASALGFYQLAFRFGNAPSTEISHTVGRVMLPAYSKQQDDTAALRRTFLKISKLVSFVTLPAAAGIIVVAPVFVRVFLGEKWVPMVRAMQILALWGGIRSFGGIFSGLFQAVGRPDYGTKLLIPRLVVLGILIYPASARFGIEGTATAVLLASGLVYPAGIYMAIRIVEARVRSFITVVGYPAVASIAMAVLVAWVDRNVLLSSGIIKFVLLVITGVCTYGLLIIGFETISDYDIRTSLWTVVESIR